MTFNAAMFYVHLDSEVCYDITVSIDTLSAVHRVMSNATWMPLGLACSHSNIKVSCLPLPVMAKLLIWFHFMPQLADSVLLTCYACLLVGWDDK